MFYVGCFPSSHIRPLFVESTMRTWGAQTNKGMATWTQRQVNTKQLGPECNWFQILGMLSIWSVPNVHEQKSCKSVSSTIILIWCPFCTCDMWNFHKRLMTGTFCPPKGSRQIISGWYALCIFFFSIGLLGLWRFDDPTKSSFFTNPKRVVAREVWMMGNFWEQQLILQVSSDIHIYIYIYIYSHRKIGTKSHSGFN